MINDVVFCTDRNFAAPTVVAIHSLLSHISTQVQLSVQIFVAGTQEDQQTLAPSLSALNSRFPEHTVEITEVPADFAWAGQGRGNFPDAAYLRLSAPGVIRRPLLYLDPDVLICGDITELLQADLSCAPVAGVTDAGYLYHWLREERDGKPAPQDFCRTRETTGVTDMRQYINSGVLLINTAVWLQEDVPGQIAGLGTLNHFLWPDQDAINKVLKGRIRTFPPRWNVVWGVEKLHKTLRRPTDLVDAGQYNEPAVIRHFTTRRKPWRFSMQRLHQPARLRLTAEYRRYALQVAREIPLPDWPAGSSRWFMYRMRRAARHLSS